MTPSPWRWDPAWAEIGAVVAMTAAYAAALTRGGPSRSRITAFGLGQLLVLAVVVTPVGTLALDYLVAAHLLQNVVLAEWAPALVVAGLGAGTAGALARTRPVRALTHPLVALPLWLAAYALWHVPLAYEAALRHDALLFLEHASYFTTGALLWWPVLRSSPRALGPAAKAAYLFGAFMLASPLGLLFAFLPEPAYNAYVDAPRLWGLSPLEDQQLGGALMAASEAVVFLGALAYFFWRFLAEEESAASPSR